ncbi:MAG: hypothetical protein RDV48_20700 [Candidatus Eremiobacteraeota bacterium]|nr:hypothetical protein [Candidatus Eremiobacteraeota bacterium]
MRNLCLVSVFLFFAFLSILPAPCAAGEGSGGPETGYPHGSPFPPGGEPSLTHTVNVFWITEGAADRTEITVKTPGSMPTQIESVFPGGRGGSPSQKNPIAASIAPECDYHLIFVPEHDRRELKSGKVYRSTGTGTLQIRIYGFKSDDYKVQPEISVKYFKGERQTGETSLKMHPVSEKIMKQEKGDKQP